MAGDSPSRISRNTSSKVVSTRIAAVAINEVYFTSDHDLLLDNNADWLDQGSRYTKPEWSSGGQLAPITHSKNLPIKMTIKLNVTATGSSVVKGKVRGKGANFEYKGRVNLRSGDVWVDVTSTASIPDRIATYMEPIEWHVTANKRTFSAGVSGPHTILVTFDTPTAPDGTTVRATLKRVSHAVDAATGKSLESDCVEAIWKVDGTGMYSLGASPYIDPWEVLGGKKADCSKLSDMFLSVCLMLGLPANKFEKKFIYPKPNKAGGRESSLSEDQETRSASAGHVHIGESHDDIDNQEKLDWLDHKGGWNQYEACILYHSDNPKKDIYYAGGTRGLKFASPDDVVYALVGSTAWKYAEEVKNNLVKYSWCLIPGPYPEQLW